MLTILHHYLAIASLVSEIVVFGASLPETSFKGLTRRSQNITSSIPRPIVVPPSGQWDGDDGKWSSFALRAGIPAQDIRVLVSTTSPETIVVLTEGCSSQAVNPVPEKCASSRGALFAPNSSAVWVDQGLYDINAPSLDRVQTAEYGLDTIGLGFVAGGENGPTLSGQNVAGVIAVSPYYMGAFGLGIQPMNYTASRNGSVSSYISTLRSQGLVPSLSWSYTAGAKYRFENGQYGQLILGGYDTSRFTSNTAVFSLAPDPRRDTVVPIQSIEFNGSTQTSLLSSPINAFIDSTDPNFWLPEETCQAFEKAFGLSKDNATGLYLINSTHYTNLKSSNPQVSFALPSTQPGGETAEIILPFSSFALSATYPFTPQDTYYFPLKVATHESQYSLGRTFLQEAYLTVDHERGNFSVTQCAWNEKAASEVTAIVSPTYGTDLPASTGRKRSKMPTGAIVGLVAALLVGIVITFVIVSCRRARRVPLPIMPTGNITIVALESVVIDDDKSAIPNSTLPPPAYRKRYPHLSDFESGTRRRIEGRRKTPATFDFKSDTLEEVFEVMGDYPAKEEEGYARESMILPPSPLRLPVRKERRPISAQTPKWRVKGPVSDTLT